MIYQIYCYKVVCDKCGKEEFIRSEKERNIDLPEGWKRINGIYPYTSEKCSECVKK
jgi:hypothetical protein